ncbi:hypothetical protein [Streptomyces acidiscabies]
MPESGFAHLCALDVLEEDVPRRFGLGTGKPLDPPATRPVPMYVCLPGEG